MRAVDLFLRSVRRNGQSAVLHHITGDTCPCVNAETGYADREWHRQNPTAEDCQGTGLINTSDSADNIRALIMPKAAVDEQTRERVGLRTEDDHLFMGAHDTTNGGLYDVSVFNDRADWIDYRGNRFTLRNIDAEYIGDDVAYYYGLMRRVAG